MLKGIKDFDKPSADYVASVDHWNLVDALNDGLCGLKRNPHEYFPKFEAELEVSYKVRIQHSAMTNVYGDVLGSLSMKAFAEHTRVEEKSVPPELYELVDNIDGCGNDVHVFLQDVNYHGINAGIDWIFIDYPKIGIDAVGDVRTKAQEKAMGLRPYWYRLSALDVLEVHVQMIYGSCKISYFKILEDLTHIVTYEIVPRAMELNGKITWSVIWSRYVKDEDDGSWVLTETGNLGTMDEIPVVPFITGRRRGNRWVFDAPLREAARLQVDCAQRESALKHLEIMTCFPIIAANGVRPDMDDATKRPRPLILAPNTVLYSQMDDAGNFGTFGRLVADSASLAHMSAEVDKIHGRIRDIGKQPLTAQSGGITRINSAMAAQKGNTAAQSWAIGLREATEAALVITGKWLGLDGEMLDPDVFIFTDFQAEVEEDKLIRNLVDMRANGDLSRETLWMELQRRKALSSTFDSAEEERRIASEAPLDPLPLNPNAP